MHWQMFLIFLTPLFLVAQADHIQIGSRPISEEAKAQIEIIRKEAAEEGAELEIAGFVFDRYPPVYYSNSHHWLTAITILDNDQYTIELQDGAVWKISHYDGYKVLNWRVNDPLTITQNNRWFTNHHYRIVNKATGSSVEANLYLGPIEQGEYSRFIIGIDHERGEVYLSDNTHWDLSYLDQAIFNEWAVNDYIIVGTNSNHSYFGSKCEALLINVNMNTNARAKQF